MLFLEPAPAIVVFLPESKDAGLYTGEQLSSHKVARDVLNMTPQQFATTGSGLDLSVAADVTRASLGMHASTHRLIGLIG